MTSHLSFTLLTVFFTFTLLAGCGKGGFAIKKEPDSTPPATQTAPAAPVTATTVITSATGSLPAGTVIPIDLLEVLDSDNSFNTPFIIASVAADVLGSDGGIVFPAGSNATLAPRVAGKLGVVSGLSIALYSINTGSLTVRFSNGVKDIAALSFLEDSSKNPAHRSVHLSAHTLLKFKLTEAVQLR